MSLPRFFSRVNDAIGPLMAGADVGEFLKSKSVLLEAASEIDQDPVHLAGFFLLVNLCARLYPALRIVAPPGVLDECQRLALQINPACDFAAGEAAADGYVSWACSRRGPESIVAAPVGWDVVVDEAQASEFHAATVPASLATAAVAAGELFRYLFREFLPKGRHRPSPGRFNVLTNGTSTNGPLPDLPSSVAIGRVVLVGAGAIGQAVVYTLARVSATGTLVVVDPEDIALSNLQRYVLTVDGDVGKSKCSLIQRALKNMIEPVCVPALWSADHPKLTNAEVICAAVDSEEVRIALQASLPRRLYNAWTQPSDLGWSRHERFGVDPCVACLYWPTQRRPSYHELVARAVRQHELRVLAYLSAKVPVDSPLAATQVPRLPGYPVPPDAESWSDRALLDDIAADLGVDKAVCAAWRGRTLQDLYHEGICGGALVRREGTDVPVEMAVPLAHQSVLAGVMLATQILVAARDDLRIHRSTATEGRLDVLAGLPQESARPRKRTKQCLCSDADFLERYRTKWPWGADR